MLIISHLPISRVSGLNANRANRYTSTMSDDRLMDIIKRWKEMGLEERLGHVPFIQKEITPILNPYIYGLVPASDFQDVVSITLIAIFTSLHTLKGSTRNQFNAWCRSIARNKASNERRKKGPIREEPFPEDEILSLADFGFVPEPLTAAKKLDLEYALNLLGKAKPECRELLWNYYVIGMEYAEIAEELGAKYDSVRMKIKRCLDTARGLMGLE